MGSKGIVACTAGLAVLLQEGIGDTIRISLTPAARAATAPGRCMSARKSCSPWGSAAFAPQVTSCPGCGRTTSHRLPGTGARTSSAHLHDTMPSGGDGTRGSKS